MTDKILTLDDILNKDLSELTALNEGLFKTEHLGSIPFTALNYAELKQARKDCKHTVRDRKGQTIEIDNDKLMIKIIVAAVDKDTRSNFTFANKQLLDKLGVVTAEAAVGKLLSPGEIFNFANAIQDASGFGQEAEEASAEEIKN